MSNYLFKVNGLNKYQNFLNRLQASHHAIILNSADEMLLDIIAKLFVMKLECHENLPCFICSSCQKVIDGNALDVEYYGTEKSILVEDSAKIIEDSYVLPIEFKNKYFILKNFDLATTQAQNKLLKIIEEPQSFDRYILLTTNLDAVLSTIKSRCEIFDVPRFDEEELKNILDYELGDGKRVSFSSEYANGNLTKLNAIFHDEDFASIYSLCQKILTNMQNSSQILEYSSQISKFKPKINVFFDILQSFYADMILIKNDKQGLIQNKEFLNGLIVLTNSTNQMALIKTIQEIQNTKQKLKFNVNFNGVIDNLLLKILEIKFLCK